MTFQGIRRCCCRAIQCLAVSTSEEPCASCSNIFWWSVHPDPRTGVSARTISGYPSSWTTIERNWNQWSSRTSKPLRQLPCRSYRSYSFRSGFRTNDHVVVSESWARPTPMKMTSNMKRCSRNYRMRVLLIIHLVHRWSRFQPRTCHPCCPSRLVLYNHCWPRISLSFYSISIDRILLNICFSLYVKVSFNKRIRPVNSVISMEDMEHVSLSVTLLKWDTDVWYHPCYLRLWWRR